MKIEQFYEEISFACLKKDVVGYSWQKLRGDLSAGLSVAMITIPQAMAFALMAGLPLSCGIFAAIFSSAIAALAGSSRHMVCGPGNATAIMILGVTAEVVQTYYPHLPIMEREGLALGILTQLTLLVALFQMLIALFRMGKLTQFVSYSVVVGYVLGVACAVIIGQGYTLLGIPPPEGMTSLYQKIFYMTTHFHNAHLPTAIVGVGSMLLIVMLQRIDRRVPASAVMLFLIGGSVYLIGYFLFSNELPIELSYAHILQKRILLVGDAGSIDGFIPRIAFPSFHIGLLNSLLPAAFAISLVSILETISVAKSLAAVSGQRLSIDQEILGLGMGNLSSSFMGAMPISGGLSRSNVILSIGGETRFAAVYNCLFVFLLLVFFGPFVTRIPLASLAAILLIHSARMFNKEQLLLCLKATSSDALVLGVTLFSCIFFSFDLAFFIGVALSVTLYLNKAAAPRLLECSIDEAGKLQSIHAVPQEGARTIRLIKVEGELFFGAADLFQRTLQTIAEDDTATKVIILQMRNARDMDATACLALKQLHDYLVRSGRVLIACEITHPIWEVLSHSGMIERIGKEYLFIADEFQPHLSAQRALRKAQEFLAKKELLLEEIEEKPAVVAAQKLDPEKVGS